jgi:hypothetical protein
MGCGASTRAAAPPDGPPATPQKSPHKGHAALTSEASDNSSYERLEPPPTRTPDQLRRAWVKSFKASDPRHHLVEYFKPGDERGPFGFLRAQDLRPRGPPSTFFSVWRPTSLTAIRMLFDGTATGKGMNVKGKSAREGPLSGFVPFLQIHEARHKAMVNTAPSGARVRIYYRNPASREEARSALQGVLDEMKAAVRQANQLIADTKAGTAVAAAAADLRDAAHHSSCWACDAYEIRAVDAHGPSAVFGLDVPERLLWEAYVVRQDIERPEGWRTGRASEPAFMDLNLQAVRGSSEPRACVWQDDGLDGMNPLRLLVAHEEPSGIKPVASDIDAFLVGSRAMRFPQPLPPAQCEMVSRLLTSIEGVLRAGPSPLGWNARWLEELKSSVSKGEAYEEMPPYGLGDPQSYDMMKRAVQRLKFCGGVRHGAECFNFWFPQELDEEFLIVWEGFQSYGSRVPWQYVKREGLRSFLLARIADGFAFPLNPKWVLCDEGWLDIFEALRASPHGQECLACWLPPSTGLAERMLRIAHDFPLGFQEQKAAGAAADGSGDGEEDGSLDWDLAGYRLRRHVVLRRARIKLKAIYNFSLLAQQGASNGRGGRGGREQAEEEEEAKVDANAEAPP